jgi:hypothetical protein
MTVARGLGWFSIGLGLAELATGGLSESPRARMLVRLYGVREIATGIGAVVQKNPEPWIKARVAGDALDLATLAAAGARRDADRGPILFAIAGVAAVTAADIWCAKALAEQSRIRPPPRDYSGRSGFPKPPGEMRGAGRAASSAAAS